MRNWNIARSKMLLFAWAGLVVFGGFMSQGRAVSATGAAGLLPDMRGSWQGRLVPEGLPVATPVGISMNVTSQWLGGFSGSFIGPDYMPGTLTGSVSVGGAVTFQGDSADVDLSHGSATFTDYGGGAAIIDGTVTVTSTYPFYAGERKIREIRPFANPGNCPCTPRAGDYVGTWGSGGTSGNIKFTVQAADHATPTKFASYFSIWIAGQQHNFGLIGTGNGSGDIVAIAHGNTGVLRMTATLTDQQFLRPSYLSGTFTFEMNDGTVITANFSTAKQ